MWCSFSLILLTTSWLASKQSPRFHDNMKRFAATEMQEDPLRRRTMQSFMIGLLGIHASTTKTTVVDSLHNTSVYSPSLFTRHVQHPISCEYALQPPERATVTKDSPHHVQWLFHDESWQLEVVLQALPTTDFSWNDLVQERLLQVQHDEHCFVTCREEPWRLSSNSLDLVYTTTHRPLQRGIRQERRTRMHWNNDVLLSAHCNGLILPERSVQAVLESIVLRWLMKLSLKQFILE